MRILRCFVNKSVTALACSEVFNERRRFIILGLTGRTGSGCTTVASILSGDFSEFCPPLPHSPANFTSDQNRKYHTCFNYLNNNWGKFYHIKLSSLITSFILERNFLDFLDFVKTIPGCSDIDFGENFSSEYESLNKKRKKIQEKTAKRNGDAYYDDEIYKFYFTEIEEFSGKIKSAFGENVSKIFQAIGNNIRNSGDPFLNGFDPKALYKIPQRANLLIKILRKKSKINEDDRVLVCLDAIRNPFEAFFFKERYSSFYLVSISCANNERVMRLRKDLKLNDAQIDSLDKTECPEKLEGEKYFTSLNVQKCIEVSDIHINNENDNDSFANLKKQLVKYVALMMHPGLITPSKSERCMQAAYDAKLNSGCISRQVGAAVANEHYSIMSLGWNTTPQGQTPCSLRDAKHLIRHEDVSAFSDYEKSNDKFRGKLKSIYMAVDNSNCGRPLCFCFKDVHNSLDGEKNQVHTRALHAEENAFLQITKRGGMEANNWILFTTASPCELCSKKAYQLGINKIYYIDPYPGIAEDQVIKSGEKMPTLLLFTGAVGRAYQQLFHPILPYKDEMELSFEIKVPNPKKQELDNLREEVKSLKLENERLKNNLSPVPLKNLSVETAHPHQ